MGMMEEMMESMMGRMSKEDKQEMMGMMMDKFFADMTVEDKQRMMEQMMPKMMEGVNMMEMMPRMMMGMMGGDSGGMMGMMSQMTGEGQGTGMPMMGQMMSQMMPQCVSTMLPGLPKEERAEFILKMIDAMLDRGCAGMSEEERNDLVARALERITA
jgi:hypothetical protein